MDVVDKIAQAEVTSNGSEVSTPVDPVTIESTKVLQEAK